MYEVKTMPLSMRQEKILALVRAHEPITGQAIAAELSVTRAALRADLSVLTLTGFLRAKPRVGYSLSVSDRQESTLAHLLQRYSVKDILSEPACIDETASIYEAAVQLFTEDAGSLSVLQEMSVLSGVISRKDILKSALGQADIQQLPVSVIMTRMPNIITVTPEESVVAAVRKLALHEIDSMPVVGGSSAPDVVGRVSKTNITRLLFQLTYLS
jgi:CBS domain-containing protein/biotin operon repressor